ncbi:MAG: 2-dehydropantoate 2-reductase [Verrucomicrobia bacterium]|nr:2-dehydropantoate 2-reductase [Verrucomicrobiota bacterium]
MKIAVIGAGAMGSVIGGLLVKAGNDVALIDVWAEAIRAINTGGLRIEDRSGKTETIRVLATDKPAQVGPVDLVLIFVKCYHTEAAVRNAAPLIDPQTVVLSLQNGWGNGPRISALVGPERLILGVCYHSATVAGPGHVQHVGKGMTFMGELDGKMTERLARIADAFNKADIEVAPTPTVLKEIWSKLALNICTLPTSALLGFYAPQLVQHEPLLDLMRALLREAVAVANAQGIALNFDERWETITGLLKRCAPNAKASMLQDVEKARQTEIDVINGAIVEAGRRLNIPTPYNHAMVCMVKSLEGSFQQLRP